MTNTARFIQRIRSITWLGDLGSVAFNELKGMNMSAQIVHQHTITGDASALRRWHVKAESKAAAEQVLREQDDIAFFGWQTGAGQSFGYQVNFVRWDSSRKAYVFEQFSALDI